MPEQTPLPGERRSHLYPILVTVLRLMAAVALVAIVLPPVAAAVAVTTLVRGPLPVGDLPEERDTITAEPSLVYDASGRQIALFRGFIKIELVSFCPLSYVFSIA